MRSPFSSRIHQIGSFAAAIACGLVLVLVSTAQAAEIAPSQEPAWGEEFIDAFFAKFRDPWVFFGFAAQGCFMMRFVWQWLASERRGESHIPVVFWYFSLGGGTMLFIYAVHIIDPVIMLGQSLGILIYLRNLRLIYLAKARDSRVGLPVAESAGSGASSAPSAKNHQPAA